MMTAIIDEATISIILSIIMITLCEAVNVYEGHKFTNFPYGVQLLQYVIDDCKTQDVKLGVPDTSCCSSLFQQRPRAWDRETSALVEALNELAGVDPCKFAGVKEWCGDNRNLMVPKYRKACDLAVKLIDNGYIVDNTVTYNADLTTRYVDVTSRIIPNHYVFHQFNTTAAVDAVIREYGAFDVCTLYSLFKFEDDIYMKGVELLDIQIGQHTVTLLFRIATKLMDKDVRRVLFLIGVPASKPLASSSLAQN